MLYAYPQLVDMARAQKTARNSRAARFASLIHFDDPLDGDLVLVHATSAPQQPTRFQFALNLKTTSALGIAVPKLILLRADEVIE